MEEKKRRILLKISGEFLMGDLSFGIDVKTIDRIAGEIKSIYEDGYEVCMVVGGGNIFRGMSAASYGMHRAAADNIGMLATVMNSIAFQNSLEKQQVPTRVMSAIAMPAICESYIRRKALRHLEKKRVLIFAAGSGNPYFTTDTAAAMRALEIGCEVLIKATTVAGIYDSDPKKNPQAVLLKEISYKDVLEKDIRIMDHTAIALTRENGIPIIVFSLSEKGNLRKVLSNEGNYSIIS
ncbi:MAG: UMP kinase [Holosporaceae bacterium]|jgi:uridylate kinase|nr:UMP kinase [Holosporaceae bacterium]